MPKKKKEKAVAKSKTPTPTDKNKDTLVKCEVDANLGEWISPPSCEKFYIDEDAKFPDISFEIKTDDPGPFQWEWEIKWTPEACNQAEGKKRFKAKSSTAFSKKNSFVSEEKKWKCELGAVIGGELQVKVKTEKTTFVRKSTILGKNPTKEKINAELDSNTNKEDCALIKKIFKQESRYRHFYSDNEPLTSFDNGYGLGQLTNPVPTYEQIWNWKEHVKEMFDKRISSARKTAKNYLDKHPGYSQDQLDLETLAAYNGIPKGQRYHTWNEKEKKWEVNSNVTCDPDQSNKGWLMTETQNKGKTLDELKKDSKTSPIYTGRCYAEHIKNAKN